MQRDDNQRHTIISISNAIQEAINGLCRESGYNITFAEINAALLDNLNSNVRHELKMERNKSNQNEKTN
jgi:hypothetical protein